MTKSRDVTDSLISAYVISAGVIVFTVALLRFVLAPQVEAAFHSPSQPKQPVHTKTVQAEMGIGYLGRFGAPLELPVGNLNGVAADEVGEVNKPAQPHFVVDRPVQDEYTVQWSQLLPSLQLVEYRNSSVPTTNELGRMRVGITNELDTIQLKGNKHVTIKNENGETITEVPKAEVVTITPTDTAYTISASTGTFTAAEVRFIPTQGGIVTVVNYEHRPAWNEDLNDNRFRDRIVVARGTDDMTWVVNVLSLGAYVRGIGEAGNSSPTAYLKAQAVAARTYATYNMIHQTKHAGEPYFLDNTSNDQVYLGYGLEKRADNWSAAARATMRQVLTYEDEVIVAPYFSQSDGRTRSWAEVWGGDGYPWAVSVDDPGCDGLELAGHGVGMSGAGAVYLAEQGYTFDQILDHYYTDVTLTTLE